MAVGRMSIKLILCIAVTSVLLYSIQVEGWSLFKRSPKIIVTTIHMPYEISPSACVEKDSDLLAQLHPCLAHLGVEAGPPLKKCCQTASKITLPCFCKGMQAWIGLPDLSVNETTILALPKLCNREVLPNTTCGGKPVPSNL